MLRFFRINDPYRLLIGFVLLVLFSLPLFIDPVSATILEIKTSILGELISGGKFMYIEVVDDTAPLASAIYGLMDLVGGRSLMFHRIIGLLLVFFQAAYFSIVLINYKAYVEKTYVFVLVFLVLALFSFDIIMLSPELMASTFLLFTINSIFKEVEFKIQRDETILSMGAYIGIASLLVFSFSLFLFISLFILIAFARINFRKVLLLIYGFVLPHLMLATLYFFWGELTPLWKYYYSSNITLDTTSFLSIKAVFIIGSIPLFYLLMSLHRVNREARLTKYQSQLMQIMLLWIVFCLVHLLVVREFSARSFIPLLPGLAYFITSYFLLIRRKWIAEIMIWIFMVGILSTSYLARYNKFSGVDYSLNFSMSSNYKDRFQAKRIVVLGEDWSLYQQNIPAMGLINWNLSQFIFSDPNNENLLIIRSAFDAELPEIIVDESNRLGSFLNRMPDIKSKYKREGVLYIKSSN